jgi:hypothetical protein
MCRESPVSMGWCQKNVAFGTLCFPKLGRRSYEARHAHKKTQSAYKTGTDWCAVCRAVKPTSPASIAARVAIIDDLQECRGDATSSECNRVEDGFLFVIFVYQPHEQCHPEHISLRS